MDILKKYLCYLLCEDFYVECIDGHLEGIWVEIWLMPLSL